MFDDRDVKRSLRTRTLRRHLVETVGCEEVFVLYGGIPYSARAVHWAADEDYEGSAALAIVIEQAQRTNTTALVMSEEVGKPEVIPGEIEAHWYFRQFRMGTAYRYVPLGAAILGRFTGSRHAATKRRVFIPLDFQGTPIPEDTYPPSNC